MDALSRRFSDTLQRSRLIAPRQHVLLACSGGLDSVVLLYLFRFVVDRDFELSVAHFDHGMRVDSATDAQWLHGLCAAWEVPLHTGSAER
ncbi:MAG: ATP-binding protein, partial [Longimicrobiales bacterium]